MLARIRGLPAPVLGWLPYVALAAGLQLSLGIIAAAVGAEGTGTIIPIRAAGSAAPAISTMDLFAHNAGIAIRSALGILTFGLYTLSVPVRSGFVIGAPERTPPACSGGHGPRWRCCPTASSSCPRSGCPRRWASGGCTPAGRSVAATGTASPCHG